MYSTIKSPTLSRQMTIPIMTSLGGLKDLQNNVGSSLIQQPTKNFERYEITIQNQKKDEELKMIEWRSKTQFPIVKVLFYKLMGKKQGDCSIIQVAIQNFPATLHILPKIPLFQVLYLLKQSAIGFERLFHRFGPFHITSKMIFIAKNNKCKVWAHEKVMNNYPQCKTKSNQIDFIAQVLRHFQQKCIKSTLSHEFFSQVISKMNKIVDLINFIDTFSKNHKIVIAPRFPIAESLGAKRIEEDEKQKAVKEDKKYGVESIKKIPKFITQMRQQKKKENDIQSRSFDSPKKQLQTLTRDLSQAFIKKPTLKQTSSTNKSSLSPAALSQVSQDNQRRQTKSNNNLSIRRLLKKKSVEVQMQSNLEFSSIYKIDVHTPNSYSSNQIASPQSNRFGVAQNLFYTKLPNKIVNPQKKERKLSDNKQQINSFLLSLPRKTHQPPLQSKKVEPTNLRNLVERVDEMGLACLSKIDETLQMNIFERNGWNKRVNNLLNFDFRQSLKSQQDGSDTFADHVNLTNENLCILGSMGKQLKSSYVDNV